MLETTPARVVSDGLDLVFHVHNPEDAIQSRHLAGELFDVEELRMMTRDLRDGDPILDVGSNVGNHAVFFSRTFPSSTVVVVEPSTEAGELLQRNLDANGCTNVVRDHVGSAFSDHEGEAILQRGGPRNLGGTRLTDRTDLSGVAPRQHRIFETVRLVRGDDVLGDLSPALVKIDVEGHELEALAGLEQTIQRARPRLFVEVDNTHLDAFEEWRREHDYEVVWTDRHYAKVTNLLLHPR
ncbi:MAG: hypothetical protein CMH83_17540 [Nocardioides sp.]|nr:hypothetical protein [Nocardioides sp.]